MEFVKKTYFSDENVRILIDIIDKVINSEFDVSIKPNCKSILSEIMKSVWEKYGHIEEINNRVHIDNLNKLSINEVIKYVKNNLNMYQRQSKDLPFQQIDSKTNVKPNSEVLLAQKISERNTLNSNIRKDDFVNLPNFNVRHIENKNEKVGNYLKTHKQAHPALVQKFLNMTPLAQEQFSKTQPLIYGNIISTLHQMNTGYIDENENRESNEDRNESTYNHNDTKVNNINANVNANVNINTGGSNDSENNNEVNLVDENNNNDDYLSFLNRLSSSEIENKEEVTEVKEEIVDAIIGEIVGVDAKARTNVDARTVTKVKVPFPKNAQKYKRNMITEFLTLDLRKDLINISNSKYCLSFPDYHNVKSVSLESCIIQSEVLQGEPYIYMIIDEIEGSYVISNRTKKHRVFGKLFMDKTINGFITYRPENCFKVFDTVGLLNKMTISFVLYDCNRIPLGKIPVKKLAKSKNTIQLLTTTSHNLSINDKVNVYFSRPDSISVNNIKVKEILSANKVSLEKTSEQIDKNSNLAFERANIKCTMTFKIMHLD